MPQVESLFNLAGVSTDDVEVLAVSIGPGSFTGLRIGLMTAKALAYGWDKMIVGVPTLEALAYGCPSADGWVSAMLDAQKGRVYQALYHWQAGMPGEVWPIRIVKAEQAFARLAELSAPVMVVGESVREYEELFATSGGSVIPAPEHSVMARAGNVGLLAYAKWQQGLAVSPAELNPLYVRRPEAEELWERRCRDKSDMKNTAGGKDELGV